MCQRLATDLYRIEICGYACQRLSTHDFYMKYLINWQILSVNTVTPETGAFYYLKTSDAKGIRGYPNVPLQPQVCSACLFRYFFAKVSPALQTSNTGLKIFLKRG